MNRLEFIDEMLKILVDGRRLDDDVQKCAERINYVIDMEIKGLLKVERIDEKK